MDVFGSAGMWRFRWIIVVALSSAAAQMSGFSFTNTPNCPNGFLHATMRYNLVVDCSTTDPNATSQLYRNGQPISSFRSPFFKYSVKGSVYTIFRFSFLTQGKYECQAHNQSGHRISWQCNIFGLPHPLKTPQFNSLGTYTSGRSFNVTCSVQAKGMRMNTLKFEFYRDNGYRYIKLPSSRVIGSAIQNGFNAVLLFINPKAMPPTHFKCVASGKDFVNNLLTKSAEGLIEIKDPSLPKITRFPAERFVVLKSSQQITIRCSASGFPNPSISWFKDGKLRLKDVTLCPETARCSNNIVLKSPTYPKDEGNYTCVAKNKDGSSSKSIAAVFRFPPRIDDSIANVAVLGLKTEKLSCKVTRTGIGQIKPTFQWMENICSKSLKECPDNWKLVDSDHIQQPPSSLATFTSTITVPRSVLAGVYYKCVATNSLGKDSHVIRFHRSRVYIPSVFIKGLSTFNAEETIWMTCVTSYGKFKRWLGKDNRTLSTSQDPRVSIERRLESNSTELAALRIINATVSDTGLYTCEGKASNNLDMNATKQVIVKAVFPPNITTMTNVTAYYYRNNQTDIQLTCHVTGNPPPRITWSKQGSRLPVLKEKESCKDIVRGYYVKKTTEGIGNVLLICNAGVRHTGWYSCEAENYKGQDMKRAYIDVLTAPNIKTSSSYHIMYKSLGSSINLKCIATGNPIPTVVWSKQLTNGSIVSSWRDGYGFVAIKIKEISKHDYGNYTCTARNSRGTDTMVIDVRASLVPRSQRYFDNKTVIIATAVGGSVGLIFAITMLVCCLVNRRQKRQLEEYKAIKYLRKGEDYKLDPDRTILEQCEDLPYDPDWEFPDKRLLLQGVIGSGTFGQVVKAEAIGILSFSARDKTSDAFKRRSRLRRRLSSSRIYQDTAGNDYSRTTVAVKTLKAEASENDYKDLATELKVMIHLGEHTNIINLLGACTKTKQLMVIMEFAPHGNLLNFLRSRREIYEATWRKTSNNPDAEFTLADLVMYSYQIARGMDFLSSKKCVHRDLAARNVLVGEDYVMKIADFGLARDIYKTDIYVKETTGLLPVKWMAPESLFDRVYTQKTDVWSFGVLLWEIQTMGGTPYPGVPVEELMDYLSEGKRMKQPNDCPPEIYAIMSDCWQQKPAERPTFAELVRRVERIVEKKISGQEADDAYISVFMDEDLRRIYYLEPKDTFSSLGTSTSGDAPESMTEDEIQSSPLPPVPCLSLENLYKSPTDDNSPYYCDPVDNGDGISRYVPTPISPKRLPKKRRGIMNYSSSQSHNNPVRSRARSDRSDEQNEKRISECSTGVESGIDMDEPYPSDLSLGRNHNNDHLPGRRDGNRQNDHSSGRRDGNHNSYNNSLGRRDQNRPDHYSLGNRNDFYQTADAEGVSFLDSSVVKEKTKETVL